MQLKGFMNKAEKENATDFYSLFLQMKFKND